MLPTARLRGHKVGLFCTLQTGVHNSPIAHFPCRYNFHAAYSPWVLAFRLQLRNSNDLKDCSSLGDISKPIQAFQQLTYTILH